MIRLNAIIFGVLLASAMPRVATSSATAKPLSKAESGLIAADTARYQAMVDRDAKALDRLLADELVYIHSSSTRQSKAEHLHDIERGGAVYKRIDTTEQVPSVYDNTGLIQGVAVFTTGGGGREVTFTLRYTSVYVRRQGRWQMVAFSCSRIPEGGVVGPRAGGGSPAGGPPDVAPSGPPSGR